MWRSAALVIGLVVTACGGIVLEDESNGSAHGSAAPDAGTEGGSENGDDGDADDGDSAAELPATCGEWLQAVTDEAARCGSLLYHRGFDEDRAMNEQLARQVCMPALRDIDCDDSVQDYMPDACEEACR